MDFEGLRLNCIKSEKRKIIWITGDLATGKSYWAECISYFLEKSGIRTTVIHLDNFLLDRSIRASTDGVYDDNSIMQLKDIDRVESINYPIYNYTVGKRVRCVDIALEKVIIVEGSLLKRFPLWKIADIIIYVESCILVQLVRLIARDKIEKGYSLLRIFRKFILRREAFVRYIAPLKEKSHMIVRNNIFVKYPELSGDDHIRFNYLKHRSEHFPEEIYAIRKKAGTQDQKKVYSIIKRAIHLLPDKQRKAVLEGAVVARGTLARDELRPSSDWDISVVFKSPDSRKVSAARLLLLYISLIKPNSTNTAGVIDANRITNQLWDRQEIVNCGILTTELITGNTDVYSTFVKNVKKRNLDKVHAGRVLRQFLLRRKLFRMMDLKNAAGGIRDIHQVVWAAQISFDLLNRNTQDVLHRISQMRMMNSWEEKILSNTIRISKGRRTSLILLQVLRIPTSIICQKVMTRIKKHLGGRNSKDSKQALGVWLGD